MRRYPHYSGQFYPADPCELASTINDYLVKVKLSTVSGEVKGVIVPHAGFVYSGQTAAYSFELLLTNMDPNQPHRLILLGPSHQVPIPEGQALTQSYTSWQTPLGEVVVDPIPPNEIFKENNLAFDLEHSLEVQLPFLQTTIPNFTITPLLFNHPSPTLFESMYGYMSITPFL